MTVDTTALIKDVVARLDVMKVGVPRIVASKAEVTVDQDKDQLDYRLFGQGVLANVTAQQGAPNIVELIEELIGHINSPIKLTRKTLLALVLGTKNRMAAMDNPQEFALQASKIIREEAIKQLVAGIQYFKDGTWYEMTEWTEEEETVSDRLVAVSNSVYDHIVVQSDTEKRFVEKLKKRKDVRPFVKLPGWFQGLDASRPVQSGLGSGDGTD